MKKKKDELFKRFTTSNKYACSTPRTREFGVNHYSILPEQIQGARRSTPKNGRSRSFCGES